MYLDPASSHYLQVCIKLYLILSPSTADLRLETSTDESRNGSFKTIIVFAIIHSCELNIASRSVRLKRSRLARDYSHQTDTVKMFSAFFFFSLAFFDYHNLLRFQQSRNLYSVLEMKRKRLICIVGLFVYEDD